MALKEAQGGGPWAQWPAPLRHRRRAALAEARAALSLEVERQAFRQFLFFEQWESLRDEARRLGLRIMGDAPMYVAGDSADVWAHPDLFKLDADLNPAVVAGVPPDYFAETGQLWGNPIYDWDRHAADGFAWWISRMRALLGLADLVRIDHFRAFVNYWEVPAGSPTAAVGRWAWGPGAAFFKRVEEALGGLPIVAEDLGELHPKVPALLRETGLPGMKVMQFAYDGDPENPFLPEHHSGNCVVYTGTHDNDTTVGWYRSLRRRAAPPGARRRGRHRAGHRLGPDPGGLGLPRLPGRGPAAGRARDRPGRADERPRLLRRQLDLAAAGRGRHPGPAGTPAAANRAAGGTGRAEP